MKKRQWVVVLIVVLAILLFIGAAVGLYIGMESGVIPSPHASWAVEPPGTLV